MQAEADRARNLPALVVEVLCVLAACGAVFRFLDPRLIFADTIVSGGDMTSHVVAFDKLAHDLLPHGRLVAWTQGNLAGYPLFQFYFPLPFLVMAFFNLFFASNVAFKIGATLAAVLYPASVAIALRRMKYSAPVPAAGALLSLLVICNERQSVWGGNLLSLLSGESCFAYGYFFFPLFLAELFRGVRSGRIPIAAVLLEAAMGLSHGYALFYGGLASLFLLLAGDSVPRAAGILAATHLLAFCLLGAWIVPLIAYMPHTTAYNYIWTLHDADDLLPPGMTPIALLAALGLAQELAMRFRGKRFDDRAILFAGFSALALLLYRIGYRIHVVDIRFLPFWFTGLLLLAAAALERIREVVRAAWVLPIAIASMLALIVPQIVSQAPVWAQWNFSGLEAKPSWKTLDSIRNRIRGDLTMSRVYYEHGADNGRLGTVRIFESLPYLANRQTLEGIYIQSSICSPFIYYIQSELSAVTSAALPDYHYSRPDPDAGIRHLDLFNARTLIMHTPEMKLRLDADSRVVASGDFGPYRIYERVGGDSGFARPLRRMPLVYTGERPKRFAYEHFIKFPAGEPAVVLPYSATPPNDWRRCARIEDISSEDNEDDADTVPAAAEIPRVSCALGEESIVVRTTRPGWPIRVAVAWHPRWRAEGGQIYAVTPGFMLLVPDREVVVLRFEHTRVEYFGMVLSIAGFGGLAGLGLLRGRRNRAAVAAGGKSKCLRTVVDAVGALIIVSLAALPSVDRWRTMQENFHYGEISVYDSPEKSLEYLSRVALEAEQTKDRSMLVKALRFRSLAYETLHRDTDALADHRRIASEFPESEWVIHSLEMLRLADDRAGDSIESRRISDRLRGLNAPAPKKAEEGLSAAIFVCPAEGLSITHN